MSKNINVLFGTETGNSEDLATSLADSLIAKGHTVLKANVEDVAVESLASMEAIVVIISTWGDGDPPTTAEEFCTGLVEASDMDLSNARYTVLSLGDTNYPEFCATGKQVDADLARLGAKAFMERTDLDTDYDYHFDEWQEKVVEALSADLVA